jgi:hypothetical protein
VNRADGKTLGHFGFAGTFGGGFHWIHMVATDSKGNVYTGEVDTGKTRPALPRQPVTKQEEADSPSLAGGG